MGLIKMLWTGDDQAIVFRFFGSFREGFEPPLQSTHNQYFAKHKKACSPNCSPRSEMAANRFKVTALLGDIQVTQ
jgi:hypothetical protein